MSEMLELRSDRALLVLPDAPSEQSGRVKVWREPVDILTYSPQLPDKNPMFLEKRVYQGSSGRVYPLPFIDRIATKPEMKQWDAIHIENEYLRIMILPEVGGRIHLGFDKTTGYDFFYRQNVMKPALVGLAGPWASGGVEFNWPQHHRPATFMPVETEIEQHDNGSVTIWCSDHDPMLRMKGMHGICISPGRAVLELKVRLYNRTPLTQTFLWWANVAVHVHERYQSFFPPDVRYVADHAKRFITTFPRSEEQYYGVDYPARARDGVPPEQVPAMYVPDGSYAADDLSWYANIPVPTSYMITETEGDFSGGYDHRKEAGVVHVANHHLAPGKKQWTWGNHEFGYAWDRSLTDNDGPYIELMAGVYTDNQPDFSWLAPWETKTFIQTWFPISRIGVPQASNVDAALSLRYEDHVVSIGLYVTRDAGEVEIVLESAGRELHRWVETATVAKPLVLTQGLPSTVDGCALAVTIRTRHGVLISYAMAASDNVAKPSAAVEPPSPDEVKTNEELYLTGLHLHQYRHATRLPELYWFEALRRDPRDSRVNTAVGLWHLRRGEFADARKHLLSAIASLTRWNPNPNDGEAYYNLGLVERYLKNDKLAYDAFYKASWSASWRGPAYLALAEIDATRHDWAAARDHLRRSLVAEGENLVALNLLAFVLQKLGELDSSVATHRGTRELDRLDIGSRWVDGIKPVGGQERLDLAFDLLRSGQMAEAAKVLAPARDVDALGTSPIELFALAQIQEKLGDGDAFETWNRASEASIDYCFPSRLEEMCVLQEAVAQYPNCYSPHYLLGNFLYDRRRHEEAMQHWEIAALLNPSFATVWRNLGIGLFNIRRSGEAAATAFDRALVANPSDARILYERDQLWKRLGRSPELRLNELNKHHDLVTERDDLSVEIAALLNQTGKSEEALDLLLNRKFQPWEGGEGLVLSQYTRAVLLLGQTALETGECARAIELFASANHPPVNLSEAKHLLANNSDVAYWLAVAYEASGDRPEAKRWWQQAARQRGDFQQMSVRRISEMTYWSGMAMLRLGYKQQAVALFHEIYDYSIELEGATPKIDYFATSLPSMLLFEENLADRNQIDALFLRSQALMGLEDVSGAVAILNNILIRESSHTGAADLLRQVRAPKARS
jgi:tetratricopeptide (TPR) repeat protein